MKFSLSRLAARQHLPAPVDVTGPQYGPPPGHCPLAANCLPHLLYAVLYMYLSLSTVAIVYSTVDKYTTLYYIRVISLGPSRFSCSHLQSPYLPTSAYLLRLSSQLSIVLQLGAWRLKLSTSNCQPPPRTDFVKQNSCNPSKHVPPS